MTGASASAASLASLSSQRKRAPKASSSAAAPVSVSTLSINDDDYSSAGDDDDDDALDALLSNDATQAAAVQQLHQRRRLRARRRFGACRLTMRGAVLGACSAWLLAALVWLRWPLYVQQVAEPLEKALGAKLRAEVEPRAVVFVLALPFALTGILFYAFESSSSGRGRGGDDDSDWKHAKWVLWLRRQRRMYVGLGLDSVDVVAIALFLLVQLNCFVGKLLIDQYTGKLAKKGLLSRAARAMGMNGLYATILSILLVSRQSFVHQSLGLSSERAARYHVWTGNVGTFALTLHGVLYGVYWHQRDELLANVLPCRDCSSVLAYKRMRNFAGLIALVLLLVVALASVEWMRRRHFRRFSLAHCLNALFVAATCVHYYPAPFWLVPPVLVYVVYRVGAVVRQGKASVLSAASLADTVVQLELCRAGGGAGDFEPGQYVYIKVDELSRREWHPFTISSSPLKNRHALRVDIKVHSRFTRRVLEMVKAHRLTSVSVDGYYGTPIRPCAHMVFIAGGSGMTPFLSFLEHLVLRSERRDTASPLSSSASTVSTTSTAASSASEYDDRTDQTVFPETIWIVWTGRDVALLEAYADLLQSVKKSTRWKTTVWLHTTPSLTSDDDIERFEVDENDESDERPTYVERFFPASMQHHAFAGNATHTAPLATFVGASVGLALAMHVVYATGDVNAVARVWWLQRLALLTASVVGAAAGGGAVLVVWKRVRGRRTGRDARSARSELEFEGQELASPVVPSTPRKYANEALAASVLLQRSFSVASTRPDVRHRLQSIHSELQETFGMAADVGLFVSGPTSLQADVAHHARALHSPLLAVHVKSFSV